jgi:hypothetical protein
VLDALVVLGQHAGQVDVGPGQSSGEGVQRGDGDVELILGMQQGGLVFGG